jgi:SAM-dependent methyltransferase
VQHETLERLRALNHEFYQTFAHHFADKRQRPQPGVLQALESIPEVERLLDLGCGHGGLAAYLQRQNTPERYLGIDISEGMLALARSAVENKRFHFAIADLSLPSWLESLKTIPRAFQPPYSVVLSFATLHHIPGSKRRQALVGEVFDLQPSRGRWFVSVWDFMQSNRLRKRILPWESVGINPEAVEAGDYLIDWRHGGQGVRYVHHFSVKELEMLARGAGFDVLETFHQDGEGGLLGLYQVWRKP